MGSENISLLIGLSVSDGQLQTVQNMYHLKVYNEKLYMAVLICCQEIM